MGCCLSQEDDRFKSRHDALLPKSRNENNRVDKSVDADVTKKRNLNGSFQPSSAVVAAADGNSNVPSKPQPSRKRVENVDLLRLHDKPPTTVIATPPSSPRQDKAPESSKEERADSRRGTKEPSSPKATKRSSRKAAHLSSVASEASARKPLDALKDQLQVSVLPSISIKAESAKNEGDQHNKRGLTTGGTDLQGQLKESKKITPTKKAKRKRKSARIVLSFRLGLLSLGHLQQITCDLSKFLVAPL
ncbi:hypothetical protein CCR75_008256 [Bremia lactucae]|uniref:Uncharacterized protein n=1 Tax=Bremia lactucae TaxID=4779 RepID=A0A976ILU5_BRELC|nr:hypothetical protein CCR75_008256 [Bremia lactucae]